MVRKHKLQRLKCGGKVKAETGLQVVEGYDFSGLQTPTNNQYSTPADKPSGMSSSTLAGISAAGNMAQSYIDSTDSNPYNAQYGYQGSTAQQLGSSTPIGGAINAVAGTVESLGSTFNNYNQYGYNENESAGEIYSAVSASFDPFSQFQKDVENKNYGRAAADLFGLNTFSGILGYRDEQGEAKQKQNEAEFQKMKTRKEAQISQNPTYNYNPVFRQGGMKYPNGGATTSERTVSTPYYRPITSTTFNQQMGRRGLDVDTTLTDPNLINQQIATAYNLNPEQDYLPFRAVTGDNGIIYQKNFGRKTGEQYDPNTGQVVDTINQPLVGYARGGSIKKSDPILDSLYSKYPALKNMGPVVIKADENFTSEATGLGDIEFFDSSTLENNTITYPTGYKVKNPNQKGLGIVYNPNTNDEQSIMLDMLHGMTKDKTYAKHREEFANAFLNSKYGQDYKKNWDAYNTKTGGDNDGEQSFKDNWIDGQIRNLMFEGTDEDFEKHRYWKDAQKEYLQDENINATFNQLKNYLTVGDGYMLQEAQVTANKKYKDGGKYYAQGGNANAELEKGEPFMTPDGQMQSISTQAPTHAQGGVDMNLPDGTIILGKNVDKETKQQYKDMGRKLKRLQDKYDKTLTGSSTQIARNTAKRMLKNVKGEFVELFNKQEGEKGFAYGGKMYRYGGKTKKYPEGGGVNPWMHDTNLYNTINNQYTTDIQPRQNISLPDLGGRPTTTVGGAAPGVGNLRSPYIPQDVAAADPQGTNFDYTQAADFAVMYGPSIYNTIAGLSTRAEAPLDARKFQNPYENEIAGMVRGRRYNYNPELQQNLRNYSTMRRDLGRVTPSKGSYLSNLQAARANKMMGDAQVLSNAQNINNQYLMQNAEMLRGLGTARANTNLEIDRINAQRRASASQQRRANFSEAVSSAQQSYLTNKQMQNQEARDQQRMNLTKDFYSDYVYTPTKGWVHKSQINEGGLI